MTDTETALRADIDRWRAQLADNDRQRAELVTKYGTIVDGVSLNVWQAIATLAAERRELRRNIAEATQTIHMLHRDEARRRREVTRA